MDASPYVEYVLHCWEAWEHPKDGTVWEFQLPESAVQGRTKAPGGNPDFKDPGHHFILRVYWMGEAGWGQHYRALATYDPADELRRSPNVLFHLTHAEYWGTHLSIPSTGHPKYHWTPEMSNLCPSWAEPSPVQESQCRSMFAAGMQWFDDHPGRFLEGDALDHHETAIRQAVPNCTSFMFSTVYSEVLWAHEHGWEAYRKTLIRTIPQTP